MFTLTITQALVNWFDEPVTNLPRELRPIAEAYISQWSSLSPDERRARAKEVDRQRVVKAGIKLSLAPFQQERDRHDPLKIAEETIGWWDGVAVMSASFWLAQPSVTPHQAALILCQYNPSNLSGADPEKNSTDEAGPVEYRQLLSAFDAMERVAPANRALSEWLKYAKCRGLKYHTWIDEYLSAVDTLRAEQGAETSRPAELIEPPNPSATLAVSTGDAVQRTAESGKREKQIRSIEKVIISLKYEKLKIPYGGKKQVEAECKRVEPKLFGGGSDPFKEAWQQAVDAGRVRTAGHDQYARR